MSDDLFRNDEDRALRDDAPLSVRMRPRSLEEYVGQEHLLGEGKLLARAIAADRVSSLILYGPPGIGKTTLAHCIRSKTKAVFERVNAVASNVDELRKIIAASQFRRRQSGQKTILFIDEIHRFNKAQQDVLMPDVEEGHLILIGATVLNPYFSIVAPLLSRSMVCELLPLSEDNIRRILLRAAKDPVRGLGARPLIVDDEAMTFLVQSSEGDARRALNALEIGALTTDPGEGGTVRIDLSVAQESVQKKQIDYDRDGDGHYDTASAFIKSMRGSDPDAALYWLAKMIAAGEDPRFIARRICICAAEDVGTADPRALVLATAAFQVSEFIGLPEARIPLAQAVVYVACAPKSNAVYKGIDAALEDVRTKRNQPVPKHLKDASYSGAKNMGRGSGYQYAHDHPENFIEQAYWDHPVRYYEPTDNGFERELRARQQARWSGRTRAGEGETSD